MSRVRDFTAAKRFVAELKDKGELNESMLSTFALALGASLSACDGRPQPPCVRIL